MMSHLRIQKNNTEVKIKKSDTDHIVAKYIVKNISVAVYLSKLYSKVYTVEITSGGKTWVI